MFYSLYSFLFSAWVVVMAPFFLWKAWRHKKYLPAMHQRLGRLPESLKSDGRPTIWIHSCSVGETLSVQPLAHALSLRFPNTRFVFSTITKTGQAIAEERFQKYGAGNTFYFPIDLAHIAHRVLDWIQPSMLITIDTEIWPNVLHEAKKRGIPVVMANGRLSPESFPYYQMAYPLTATVFDNYAALVMKAQEDADRLQRLGAPPSKLSVSGNLKYDRDTVEKEVSETQAREMDTVFGLTTTDAPLIVAGSTHEDEEQTLLDVLQRVRQTPSLANTRLMIVPRHPERFGLVAALAERSGFSVKRRTDGDLTPQPPLLQRGGAGKDKPASPSPLSGGEGPGVRSPSGADVLILDTLGELAAAYQFATVVFVGGTLIPHGGQSIMEPAVYAKPIVIGPSMKNFPGIIDDFRARGGVAHISATETNKEAQKQQLTEQFVRLLQDAEVRTQMGAAARSVFEGSQGATKFTVDKIAAILEGKLSK